MKQTEVRRKRWLRNIAGSWELDLNGNIIKQKGKMDIKLKQKLEEIFLELGFEKMIIGEKQYEYLVYNNCYCRITYLQEWRAFVIESADCIEDALNGVLEDGDLYYTDILQENILSKFRSDIVAYYMD